MFTEGGIRFHQTLDPLKNQNYPVDKKRINGEGLKILTGHRRYVAGVRE